MSDATDRALDGIVSRQKARRQVVELYRTTNLTSAAIAAQVGVSRKTVYRWLREAGVSLGRNANHAMAARPERCPSGLTDEIALLRRDVTVMMSQLGRLEGLLAALVGAAT